MKTRLWIFALLVVAALAVHLALLSGRVARSAEEAMNSRRAVAQTRLQAQMDLIEARLAPRVLAAAPELVELLKAPTDVTQPMPKPDERALKAAMGAGSGEPDLLIVANPQGAIRQLKGKGSAQILPAAQVTTLPLARAVLEGGRPKPTFAVVDGSLFRLAGAAMPQTSGAVVVGTLIDEALAVRLRPLLDADVTFFDGSHIVASSVQQQRRGELQEWFRHPSKEGYGNLDVRLPAPAGMAFSGRLPVWANRRGYRAAFVPLDSGVQAVVSIPAAMYLAWLGRYQAFYLIALVGLVLFALLWGLVPVASAPVERVYPPTPLVLREERPVPASLTPTAQPELVKPAPETLPWVASEEEPGGWDHLGESRLRADGQPETTAPAAAEPVAKPVEPSAERPAPAAELPAAAEPALHEEPKAASPAAGSGAGHALLDAGPLQLASDGVLSGPADEKKPEEEPAPALEPVAPEAARPGAEFSFAGLLDEAHEAASAPRAKVVDEPPKPALHASLFDETREETNPSAPSAALIAQTRGESFREFAARKDEVAGEYFPGDEPTRIEPVSAALLDKLREIDDEKEGPRTVEHEPERPKLEPLPLVEGEALPAEEKPAHPGDETTDEFAKHKTEGEPPPPPLELEAQPAETWPEPPQSEVVTARQPREDIKQEEPTQEEPKHEEPKHEEPPQQEEPAQVAAAGSPSLDAAMAEAKTPPAEAAHVGDITLTNLQLPPALRPMIPPPALAGDADEPHWRDTFQKFLAARVQTGEPSEKLSYEKFAAKLKKNREELVAKHNCKGVRFSVYVKEGKAAIKASALK